MALNLTGLAAPEAYHRAYANEGADFEPSAIHHQPLVNPLKEYSQDIDTPDRPLLNSFWATPDSNVQNGVPTIDSPFDKNSAWNQFYNNDPNKNFSQWDIAPYTSARKLPLSAEMSVSTWQRPLPGDLLKPPKREFTNQGFFEDPAYVMPQNNVHGMAPTHTLAHEWIGNYNVKGVVGDGQLNGLTPFEFEGQSADDVDGATFIGGANGAYSTSRDLEAGTKRYWRDLDMRKGLQQLYWQVPNPQAPNGVQGGASGFDYQRDPTNMVTREYMRSAVPQSTSGQGPVTRPTEVQFNETMQPKKIPEFEYAGAANGQSRNDLYVTPTDLALGELKRTYKDKYGSQLDHMWNPQSTQSSAMQVSLTRCNLQNRRNTPYIQKDTDPSMIQPFLDNPYRPKYLYSAT